MPKKSKLRHDESTTSKSTAPRMLPEWIDRFEIEVNDSQRALKVNRKRLAELARSVLGNEKCLSAVISLTLVDNRMIHELNVRYLQHDYPTDVLSFLLECEVDPKMLPIPKTAPRGYGKRLEGEIIVSVEMAKQTAAKYQWKPQDELSLYVVHGLLHLCGYDDRRPKDLAVMQHRERELLALWGLLPHVDPR
jgi:probable rRNA maturation factor